MIRPLLLRATVVLLIFCRIAPGQRPDPIAFWQSPQPGGNSFNIVPPDEAYFKALRATGATWVRLAFAKWSGTGRDFLIGNADHYTGIPAADLAVLIRSLDAAQAAGLKVVIVPLSLPGERWRQQNNDTPDTRLWNDKRYRQQAAAFWRDLALALKDHPAVVAYNILNEPAVEQKLGLDPVADASTRSAWYAKYRGTAHDLPAFYDSMTAAIREVDPSTPIMVDSGWYGDPNGFSYWPAKLSDSRTLYSVHMYQPWEATSATNLKRNPPYRYPGVKDWYGPQQVVWDKPQLATDIQSPFDWAAAHGIPANHVIAGEFGCMRRWADCGTYLRDVLDILDAHHASWAFYSFREDAWEGMDYELSPTLSPDSFYESDNAVKNQMRAKSAHPLLDIIEAHMPSSSAKP